MANINISGLNAISTDIFFDIENLLNDLSENELKIFGGYQVNRSSKPPTKCRIPNPSPVEPYPTLIID
jgi:hypothetical protein